MTRDKTLTAPPPHQIFINTTETLSIGRFFATKGWGGGGLGKLKIQILKSHEKIMKKSFNSSDLYALAISDYNYFVYLLTSTESQFNFLTFLERFYKLFAKYLLFDNLGLKLC